jgi:hypothetical protein
VRITIRKVVAVPPARAVAAYASPAFYEGRPRRDDIAELGVVSHEDDGSRVLIEVRYAFTGSVSSAVRRVVRPDKMSFVRRMEVLPAEMRAQWVVLPDHYPDRLTSSGEFRFEPGPDAPESTLVEIDGELKVHVPVVGRKAEPGIVKPLQSYLEDEAASIPQWADGLGPTPPAGG